VLIVQGLGIEDLRASFRDHVLIMATESADLR